MKIQLNFEQYCTLVLKQIFWLIVIKKFCAFTSEASLCIDDIRNRQRWVPFKKQQIERDLKAFVLPITTPPQPNHKFNIWKWEIPNHNHLTDSYFWSEKRKIICWYHQRLFYYRYFITDQSFKVAYRQT